MKRLIPLLLFLCACAASPGNRYFESPAPTAIQTGGIRMIPIQTPKGTFHVWTKRVGNAAGDSAHGGRGGHAEP